MTLIEMVLTLGIGLVAGTVGGMAGIGGSIIMLPALGLVLGYDSEGKNEQHLYIAAAMCVNVVVAFFARGQHIKAGAVRAGLVRRLLPSMALAIIGGVLLGLAFDGSVPRMALVVFLLAYCVYNLASLVWRLPDAAADGDDPSVGKLVGIGAVTGIAAGFLGIGGGIVMVPMLQAGRVPLRNAIAASAAVMWVTALVGSIVKLATLARFGMEPMDALTIAGPMALGAVFGAKLGAWMTHRVELKWLRLVMAVVLAGAAVRLAMG